MTKTLLRSGAAILALSAAAPAMAQEISMIVCGDEMDPIQQKYIDQWESENEGWTVAPEVVGWGQCQDKVTTLAVAGTPVGIAYVGSRTLKEFAEFGLIEPIPMTEKEKASYYPNVVDTVTYQGEQWGVPVAFSTKAFYWNKGLFEEAGLDPETPPTTWEEVIADAKAVTENTDSAGFGLVAKTFDNTVHQFLHWVYTNNGKVVDDEGNIVLDSPQNLAALQAYKDLVPYSEEGPTAYEQNEVRAIFLDGGVAMMHAAVSTVQRLEDTDIDWGVANLPLGPDAEGPGTLLITDSLAVFSGSGYEDKAMDLAKYITAPGPQEEYDLSYGLTPLRPSDNIDALVEENPYWKPFIDGIEYGGPEPLFTDYRGFQNIMIEMVQSVVTGQAEPAEALSKADAALKELD
ncbi:extracellular solute-binding protein [Allosediminivita pacifica]|uniref:Carbohydrate ABC transporter substrate-binding protein (CUT1 family) n=1 Tax=Allosediminivita pacifica TaxID=1267769 RepID=A0A2T6BAA7_9RHOB|nr:extracellular solute-binding protein [Allosediminivita pacifica]PTX52968.1 carbohydrate ABC transporter substrate-binding protein (CUT1 family) [Allosediminivita pacifica]GGA94123.1 ABC transporter substrate-binding protein [Allosediminivita pacifica]